MLGSYLALELPVPQRVQNHVTNLVEDQRARNYKRWRPKRIILLRHGQTHGYVHTCDCEIDGVPVCASKPEHDRPLTDKGFEQALLAGNELKALIGDEKTRFLVSPYRACKQTFDCVSVPFDPTKCNFREEPRVRNQDLGPWWERMDANEIVRRKDEIRREAGNFYFRWPGGESCADVYDRVSQLLESLHKEWERPHADNYVLVSHTGVHCTARARALEVALLDFCKPCQLQSAFRRLTSASSGRCAHPCPRSHMPDPAHEMVPLGRGHLRET
jgi:broad specificity phosphatase PhoE